MDKKTLLEKEFDKTIINYINLISYFIKHCVFALVMALILFGFLFYVSSHYLNQSTLAIQILLLTVFLRMSYLVLQVHVQTKRLLSFVIKIFKLSLTVKSKFSTIEIKKDEEVLLVLKMFPQSNSLHLNEIRKAMKFINKYYFKEKERENNY